MSHYRLLRILMTSLFLAGRAGVAQGAANPDIEYHYQVDVKLFSVQEGTQGPIKESYRAYGSGSAEPGGGIGLGCGEDDFCFMTNLRAFEEEGKFFIEIALSPEKNSSLGNPSGKNPLKLKKERLAMSDLKPVTLELARNEKGKRTYKMSLLPSVRRIDHTKKQVEASTLHLDLWSFDRCDVIVDQWRYAGLINCSGERIAFMDIPGYAMIKFALQPFPGAEPLGSMQDGEVVIEKPNGLDIQTVWIRNAKVGQPAMTIPGGPYKVWVLWSPATRTIKQAAKEMSDIDLKSAMQGLNLDEATQKRQLAQQQALKEGIAKLNEADLAPDGIIPQMLRGVPMVTGLATQIGDKVITWRDNPPNHNKK